MHLISAILHLMQYHSYIKVIKTHFYAMYIFVPIHTHILISPVNFKVKKIYFDHKFVLIQNFRWVTWSIINFLINWYFILILERILINLNIQTKTWLVLKWNGKYSIQCHGCLAPCIDKTYNKIQNNALDKHVTHMRDCKTEWIHRHKVIYCSLRLTDTCIHWSLSNEIFLWRWLTP